MFVAPCAPEDVAHGFIQIAVQQMANAIKKISVARGYDVTRYTLQCFGGAGGQHACLVADALGMRVIGFDPFAKNLPDYVQSVPLDAIWREADAISLHCPLTAATRPAPGSRRAGATH